MYFIQLKELIFEEYTLKLNEIVLLSTNVKYHGLSNDLYHPMNVFFKTSLLSFFILLSSLCGCGTQC